MRFKTTTVFSQPFSHRLLPVQDLSVNAFPALELHLHGGLVPQRERLDLALCERWVVLPLQGEGLLKIRRHDVH